MNRMLLPNHTVCQSVAGSLNILTDVCALLFGHMRRVYVWTIPQRTRSGMIG
jgi:hypothetical protein